MTTDSITSEPTLEERARAYLDDLGCTCPGCLSDGELRDAVYRLTLADAVAQLDVRVPDWRTRVDPDRLNMDDPRNCVLGQLFGDYSTGLGALYGVDRRYGPGYAAFSSSFPVGLWRELLTVVPA